LGKILLQLCQFNVAAERARLWLADEAAGGTILLQPVAQIGYDDDSEPIELDVNGAMISHLRRYPPMPLSSYELTSLPAFAAMRAKEKDRLRAGNTEIIIPLLAGDSLVGALTLGQKYTAETYNHTELNWLQDLSIQGGPLLWQSRQLHQSITELQSMRAETEEYFREIRQLRELRSLHERFAHLISPALRQPFQEIDQTIKELEDADENNGAVAIFSDLNQQLAQLRLMLNNLIVNATRIRSHDGFSFQSVNLLDVIDDAVGDLASMAAARQVTVTVTANIQLPIVSGDAHRLYDAVHHLLHNAIRFNKIGGRVNVETGTSGDQVYIHVKDTGIGIEQEQLARIWQGPALNHDRQLKNAGAGLGLLLTRFIIRVHGGDIEASSNIDHGSTFSLYLPMAAAESLDVASA
jgi:signal transduction histidine kinase